MGKKSFLMHYKPKIAITELTVEVFISIADVHIPNLLQTNTAATPPTFEALL